MKYDEAFLSLFSIKDSALVVVDKQNAYMDRATLDKRKCKLPINFDSTFSMIEVFIVTARERGLPVLWTQMNENSDTSPPAMVQKMEITERVFGSPPLYSKPGSFDYQFAGSVLPNEDEFVLHKEHYDGFSNELLDQHLKHLGVSSIILIGGYTSRCVLATAFGASSNNYNVLLLKDLTFEPQDYMCDSPSAYRIVDAIIGYCSDHKSLVESWL